MGVGFNIPFENPGADCGPPQFALPVDDRLGPSNTDEYARNHRFIIEIAAPLHDNNANNRSILLNAEKCTRPSVEFDEIKIHNGQDEIYRPGKHRWSPIEFTFYERIGASQRDNGLVANPLGQPNLAAQAIYNWWAGASNYSLLDFENSSQYLPETYQYDVHMSMIDGLGRPVWKYILRECWPLKVNATDVNYSDTELSRITVVLRYNRAEELF